MAHSAFTLATSGGSIDPHWILLDSESTASIFVNRALLSNFRIANDPLVTVRNGDIARASTITYLTLWGPSSERSPRETFCLNDFFVSKFVKMNLELSLC